MERSSGPPNSQIRLDAHVIAVHAVGLLEHERGDPDATHLGPELDRWTAALDRLPAGRIERRLVVGDPVEALGTVVADSAADLVVVGTRGTGTRTRHAAREHQPAAG